MELLVFTAILLAVVCATSGFLLHRRRQYEQQFAHIPGPKGFPVLQNALQLDLPRLPWILTAWRKVYGPVYKIGMIGTYAVVINGYDAINEYLGKGGNSTAGKPRSFARTYLFKNTGFSQPFPDDTWRLSRKIFHQHMKQLVSGLHILEEMITQNSMDMIDTFERAADNAMEIDPFDITHDIALKMILMLICGDQLSDDDPSFQDSKEYEPLVWKVFDTSFDAALLEAFPWLIHFPLPRSRLIKRASELQSRLTLDLKRRALSHDPQKTLIGCLYQHSKGDHGSVYLKEDDVLLAAATVLFAGRGTSSLIFTFLLTNLAHHPEIQDQIAKEINSVSPDPAEYVGLKFREGLPYTQATLLEHMRYHSLIALHGTKSTTSTTTVCGITVPANTQFFPNAWGIHHDRAFWGDPGIFQPERFLNKTGELVPADDPKRRRLMPFGVGRRSCPGEQFAMSHLFLRLANTCKKFKIVPGRENTIGSVSLEALRYHFLMYPPRVKIGFEKRTL